MIHPTYEEPAINMTKSEAAAGLIEFWKEREIYAKNTEYLDIFMFAAAMTIFMILGLSIGPYKLHIIFTLLFLQLGCYFWRMNIGYPHDQYEDPIEQLKKQKAKMIAYQTNVSKVYFIGTPILVIAKISSYFLFNHYTSWMFIAFFAGFILISGVMVFFFSRKHYAKQLKDANIVLNLAE